MAGKTTKHRCSDNARTGPVWYFLWSQELSLLTLKKFQGRSLLHQNVIKLSRLHTLRSCSGRKKSHSLYLKWNSAYMACIRKLASYTKFYKYCTTSTKTAWILFTLILAWQQWTAVIQWCQNGPNQETRMHFNRYSFSYIYMCNSLSNFFFHW